MSDRYCARHYAERTPKRFQHWPTQKILPAAGALAIIGVAIAGAGTIIQIDNGSGSGNSVAAYESTYYPPDRNEAVSRAARGEARTSASASPTTATPSTAPAASSASTTHSAKPKASAKTTTTKTSTVVSTGSCEASFYDEPQGTANGETFNPYALTAAHKSLPFNTRVRVTNLANGKTVTVRINDRGPYVDGRCLDLSLAAFEKIASTSAGVAEVKYEVLAS